ncbi:hypothetical protein DFH27DRAFT_539713 [Peziza echinospora]|nr:hypothetical protein DFH27DRAFT_539713 [Peziza echinospora]
MFWDWRIGDISAYIISVWLVFFVLVSSFFLSSFLLKLCSNRSFWAVYMYNSSWPTEKKNEEKTDCFRNVPDSEASADIDYEFMLGNFNTYFVVAPNAMITTIILALMFLFSSILRLRSSSFMD